MIPTWILRSPSTTASSSYSEIATASFDLQRSQRISLGNDSTGLAAVDFDKDGRTDLVSVDAQLGRMTLLRQAVALRDFVRESTFVPVSTMPIGDGPLHVVPADLDGDGVVDLAVAARDDRRVDVLHANPFQHQVARMTDAPIGRNQFVQFGSFPLESGTISGRVWTDANNNGIRDLNALACQDCVESYRSRAIVYLDQNDNGRLDVNTEAFLYTDEHGEYQFLGLEAGTYRVRTQLPPDHVQSAPMFDRDVILSRNQSVTDIHFGIAPPGEISGVVYYDTNGNGQLDAGEQRLSDWHVFIDENQDGAHTTGEPETRTHSNGSYSFTLPEGRYTIGQTLLAGWDPNVETSRTIDLDQSERLSVSFANLGAYDVGGLVWKDDNANGVFDGDERDLTGLRVFIDGNRNGKFDLGEIADQTDHDGKYEVVVPPGVHRMYAERPNASFRQTVPAEPFFMVDATSGAPHRSFDFGLRFGTRDADGFVWLDSNSDLARGPGEPGAEGLRVYVDDNENHKWDASEPFALTDSSGYYQILGARFADLRLESDEGWLQSWPIREARDVLWQGFVDQVVVTDSRVLLLSHSVSLKISQMDSAQTGAVSLVEELTLPGLTGSVDDVIVTDLNADDFVDLAILSYDEEIQIWYALGSADGSFDLSDQRTQITFPEQPGLYHNVFDILLGGTGADGITDLIVLKSFAYDPRVISTVQAERLMATETREFVLHGSGAENHLVFDTLSDIGPLQARKQHSIEDLDGDLQRDRILVTDYTVTEDDRQSSIIEFRSSQNQRIEQIELLHLYGGHQIIDIDHDGDNDVLVSGKTLGDQNIVSLLENTPNGFTRYPFVGGSLVAAGDVNQDGLNDLVLSDRILLQTDSSLATVQLTDLRFNQIHVSLDDDFQSSILVDVNSDGERDVVTKRGVVLAPLFAPDVAGDSHDFTVVSIPDHDQDGVASQTEARAPGGGDGNSDGIPDRDQVNVASIPNAIDGSYLTIAAPPGTRLENVDVFENPDPANSPRGVLFPFGFVSFEVSGLAPGEHTFVQIIIHGAPTPTSFYKYGPTPLNQSDHFYLFDASGRADCVSDPNCVGAQMSGNTVTLFFTDGATGDADRRANGRVVDPGGLGVVPGDVNHDRVFDSTDLIDVFRAGKYEDGIPFNATYEEGDWDGDGDFTSSDLVLAFQAGSYVAGSRPTQLDLPDWNGLTSRRRGQTTQIPNLVVASLAVDAVFIEDDESVHWARQCC